LREGIEQRLIGAASIGTVAIIRVEVRSFHRSEHEDPSPDHA
jgi:hypothetical protein